MPGRSRGIGATRDVLVRRFSGSALAVLGARENRAEITKSGIAAPDKRQLLFPPPVLDLFFPADRGAHIGEWLKVDEARNVVISGEPRAKLGLVLSYATFKKIRYAGVEDAGGTCQDIDMVNSHR